VRVIPVMDVFNGVVVHAVKGEREKYKPLRSRICLSFNPMEVALAFKSLGLKELYVADLDMILGKGENLNLLPPIKGLTGLRIMVDAGVNSVVKAEKVLRGGASKVVVGTETLKGLNELKEILEAVGGDKVVASVDLRFGSVVSLSAELSGMGPVELAKTLERVGVEELIVLELTRVGSRLGPDVELAELVARAVIIPVIVGGGIRSVKDILELLRVGVSGVLVATALHDEALKAEDLTAYFSLPSSGFKRSQLPRP